jgi:tetratricopeptide (TPR) repeat protein
METLKPYQLADEGQAAYQNKEYLSAAQIYMAAAEAFKAQGDEIKAAEMLNNCSVAYLKEGEAVNAFAAAQGTERVFAQIGDLKQQAMSIGNQAAALEKLKRIDEAMQAYEKSAALLLEAGDWEFRYYVMQSISSLQLRKRKYLEAYATLRVGIMGVKKPNLKQRLLKSLIQIPYKLIK